MWRDENTAHAGGRKAKKKNFLASEFLGLRAILLLGLAVAVRLFESFSPAGNERQALEDIGIKQNSAFRSIHPSNASSRLGWRKAFPKRPERLKKNETDDVFCVFMCIASVSTKNTKQFADDLWSWTRKLTTWGLAGQTYSDFQVLVDHPGDVSEISYRTLDTRRMTCSTANVDQIVQEEQRKCSWIVTTRVDPGAYMKPGFVADVIALLRKSVWQVPQVHSILLSSRDVRQLTVDGNAAERCEISEITYGQGGGPWGQTLAVKYASWKKLGGLTVTETTYDTLWDEAWEKYSSEFPIMPVKLPNVHAFEITTRLSGASWPWTDGLPKCEEKKRDMMLGLALFTQYGRAPLPSTKFVDVCESFGTFQDSDETAALFNNSDQECHEARGFFWETGGYHSREKRSKKSAVKKQLCTFVQVTGTDKGAEQGYANEFWQWTETMTLKHALGRQSSRDFAVLINPPLGRKVPSGNLTVWNKQVNSLGVASILKEVEGNSTCEWVVSVHLPGGGYLEENYIQNLHKTLRSTLRKHEKLDAVILAFEKEKQLVLDHARDASPNPALKTSPLACRVRTVEHDAAGAETGRAIAVRARYFRQNRGATAAECPRAPVGCVQRRGVPKSKIAHGHLTGVGVDVVTRVAPNFPWESVAEASCGGVKMDAGRAALALAVAAPASVPRETTLLSACRSSVQVQKSLGQRAMFEGMSCQQAAESLLQRGQAKKQ